MVTVKEDLNLLNYPWEGKAKEVVETVDRFGKTLQLELILNSSFPEGIYKSKLVSIMNDELLVYCWLGIDTKESIENEYEGIVNDALNEGKYLVQSLIEHLTDLNEDVSHAEREAEYDRIMRIFKGTWKSYAERIDQNRSNLRMLTEREKSSQR
jgi:hypothetical protein